MSPPDASSKRYSLRNFGLCEQLHQELHDVAIRKVSGDILKMLLATKDLQFLQARNRMDIPHGLFGLKLDDFYERRQLDTVYLDVLHMVCQHALQQAKTCIVLDGLQELIQNLFIGYINRNMEPIKHEIAKSLKLLTIYETITEEYRHTKNQVNIAFNLMDQVYANSAAFANRLKNDTYEALNKYMESTLILNKLQFRTHVSYDKRTAEQYIYEMSNAEEHLRNTLENIYRTHGIEEQVSDWNILRQNMEIINLKKKIAALSLEYEQQAEFYDGEIAYQSSMIEIMRNRYNDCVDKLPFFAIEMVKLREWEIEQEKKDRKAAKALLAADKPKKKKKDDKKKGVMTRKR